eukprot:jgi/Psemu1/44705/gm1.44705_g
MPPQREESDVGGEEGAPAAAPNQMDSTEGGEGDSYWEAPKEVTLEGRTLSTLDMSLLATEHPDEEKEKKDTYWEATPEQALAGKSLSTLELTMLETEHPVAAATAASVAKPSPKPVILAVEPDEPEPSYWDAPKEKTLEGRTLSTLDMSMLEKEHPDEDKEKKDDYWEATPERSLDGKTLSSLDMAMLEANNLEEQQRKKDSYWEQAPIDKSLEGRTLSKLDLSQLQTSHPDEKKEQSDSYWDAPEDGKLQGKTLSTINITTLESEGKSAAEAGTPSYWDDAPIEASLQGKTLSQVDMSAMVKQHLDEPSSNPGEAAPYWDWKIKAFKKTLSKLSLSNLRSGSNKDVIVIDDDFCVHGANNSRTNSSNSLASNGSTSSSGGASNRTPVKPITKKTHKMRDTWRKSFHRLSTNNLEQLDESTSSGPRLMGSRIFKSRNKLDISGSSRGSTGSSDVESRLVAHSSNNMTIPSIRNEAE